MLGMEIDLETLRFYRDDPRRRVVHFVKDYEEGKSGEGSYAKTYCGQWAHESQVVLRKYSHVAADDWCRRCYAYRRKAIQSDSWTFR